MISILYSLHSLDCSATYYGFIVYVDPVRSRCHLSSSHLTRRTYRVKRTYCRPLFLFFLFLIPLYPRSCYTLCSLGSIRVVCSYICY